MWTNASEELNFKIVFTLNLYNHMRFVASILNNASRERFCHYRKFCWTMLFENFPWLLKHFGKSVLLMKDQKVISFNVASSQIPKVYLSESLPCIRFSPSFFQYMAVRSGQYCSNH